MRTQPFGQSHDFGDEDIAALTEVIRSGNIGKGPQVAQFEREFAARHGVKHAISVTSGTAAMHVCIGRSIPIPATRLSFRLGPLEAASSVRYYTTASPYSPILTTLSPLTRKTSRQRSRHGRGRLSPCIYLAILAAWMHCGRLRDVTNFS